jgi:ligand-binding sensor protein
MIMMKYMQQGKRPALEELEVLNKLLQNISETDLVNVPDEDIKEGDVYRVSDGNTYIKGCFETPEVSTPCSKCSNYLESLRTGKTLVCNCTLGLPSITCTYEYKSNIE